ncbi:TonB-dependent siderophore receptor [Neptuniibacter sp. 1_MG-2023]|uniref:TonB-dependent receptor plug domain-containing protein n=1 Tax=Neptuniibacter sp. 1_MG-2023 TaxID=3062662 RepID=UPI0026E3C08C|nr:TonB-dependent receptor [Neptuniibacter sp. 1_MG-2023]MDO6594808.1 TonB-dependent receptor [Neptuniibacter sp. 1_MG-2023]
MTQTWTVKNLLSIILPVFILVAGAEAKENTPLPEFTEEDIFIDIPQVFSATRQTQKLTEAPASITILSQKDIRAMGALKITDVLRMVPGMQSYNVTANRSAATYHGMSDDHPGRMEVMINGHSVYLPLLSTVAWETIGITVQDIDYIEVVRGSNAPAYGSNAFLGAINIVTKSPISDQNNKLSTTQGALNSQQYGFSHSETSDSIAYRLSTHFEENDGYNIYDDGFLNRVVNLSGTYTPSFADTIDFNMGVSSGFIYLGQADNIDNNFSPREHESNFQHIRWNHILDAENELGLSFTHNYLDLNEEFTSSGDALIFYQQIPTNLYPFADAIADGLGLASIQPLGSEHGTMHLYDLELEHRYNPNSNISTIWGLGYRNESAKSDTLLVNQGTVTEDKWRLFGNVQWKPLQQLAFNAGGMFESTSIAAAHFSPRLAANYSLTPSSTIRVSATKAYRTPSLLEKNGLSALLNNSGGYYDLVAIPNPDLEPEELTSYELGYFHQWKETGSFLDIRVFTEKIDNAFNSYYINALGVDDVDDGYRMLTNSAKWKNIGAEFQFKLQPHPNFSVLTNYSYINTKGERDRGYGRDIDSLDDRTPMHTAALLTEWKATNTLSISAAQYYMSKVNWLEGSHREQYRRTDLILSDSFRLKNAVLNTRLIVQNLFDDPYEDFYEYNIFDRRAYIQLQLDF